MRFAALRAGLVFVALLLLIVVSSEPVTANDAFSYHWPIKPFNRQHPIRGAFGDPRTLNKDGPFGTTGPKDPGSYSFHTGIDIAAPPGTPVYPVVSGKVVRITPHEIRVDSSHDRMFDYWHLRWNVQVGQDVVAEQTVLGWIQQPSNAVHVGEVDGRHGINPLERGRIAPYSDHTTPRIVSLDVEKAGAPPDRTRGGKVAVDDKLAIEAFDPPAVPIPGPWAGMPQTPALVQWRLRTDRHWSRWHIAIDFREIIPHNYDFWRVYAPGTYQNFPVFDHKYGWKVRGRYLFKIGLDLHTLSPGAYELEARVADVRGNSSTRTWPLEILG